MTKHLEAPIDKSEIPNQKGAYYLQFTVKSSRTVDVGALGPIEFPSGQYRYYGSAYGPGGLSARLLRHLSDDKKCHWHIDYLTEAFEIQSVGFDREATECELLARELKQSWKYLTNQLGASDCQNCRSHLLWKAIYEVNSSQS